MKRAIIVDDSVRDFPPEGADFHADLEIVEVPDEVALGWIRDDNGTFSAPPPFEVPPQRQFTFLEFMDLFTQEEQLNVAGAAMTSVAVKLWYDRAVGASIIDLDDGRTVAGVLALADAGLIEGGRANDVLAGAPPP